jgi:pimeloyl-ACP methyl ester carboxylesterase
MNRTTLPLTPEQVASPDGGALPAALPAERFEFQGLSCYVAGQGPPILLLHSVNAAASAAEVRPMFDHLRASRTVFALDLPGFGFSARSRRNYTPRLMTDAVHAIAAQIRLRCGSAPLDAVAVSLACEFLARAATELPSGYRSLVFVSPTGLDGYKPWRQAEGSTREVPLMHPLLTAFGLGPLWYRLLTRPGVVRYFLERSWGTKRIDETMWAYAVKTARVPGAWHAPLQFLAGRLFSADIHTVYEKLTQPVWMAHGVRGDFKDFRAMQILPKLARWQRTPFVTGAMPYAEQPREFFARMDACLRGAARTTSAATHAV